jgi:parvulin-like peptidyl-prolyl isomerase
MDFDEKEQDKEQEQEQKEEVKISKNMNQKVKIGLIVLLILVSMIGGYFIINKINLLVVAKKNQNIGMTDPINIDQNQKSPDTKLNPDTSKIIDPNNNQVPAGKIIYKIGSVNITDKQLEIEMAKITPVDFEQRMKGASENDQKVYRSQIREDALKNLVDQIYFNLYLQEQKINITQNDIAQTEKDMTEMMKSAHEQQNPGVPFDLEQRLKQFNISRDLFMEDVKNQTIYRLATASIINKITATAEEAKEFFKKHPELYNEPAKADLKNILLSSEQDADVVIKELNQGADFAELAKLKSQDPQAKTNGGALGWIYNDRTRVPEEILRVIFDPQVKLNTPLKIQLETQWYVMLVTSIQKEIVKSYEDMKEKALYDTKQDKQSIAIQKLIKELETKYGKPIPQK